ncbi:hypothetical protein MAR_020484, partial [Mya arenaria]
WLVVKVVKVGACRYIAGTAPISGCFALRRTSPDLKGHGKIKEYGRSKGKVQNKYFRGETPSTSTLLSAEEAYESVYDTIKNVQKIRVQQLSLSTFNMDTNNANPVSGIQNNNHDVCNFDGINTIKKNAVSFIEQNDTVTQNTETSKTRHKT